MSDIKHDSIDDDLTLCQEKIRRLQVNIASLRISRRILMNLLEDTQNSSREEIRQLTLEQQHLKRLNSGYANAIWEKNKRIYELENQLRK